MMEALKILNRTTIILVISILIWSLSFQSAFAAWELNTDRPGMDYKSFWIDGEVITGVQKCENACKDDPNCRSFTYVKPGVQGSQGRCYLKEGIPAAITDKSCCTSGVVRPQTKEDKCQIYAANAIQQNKSNLGFNCGYSGPRWEENFQSHFNWCMNVAESSANFETAEREKLINQCLQPSVSGDLAAQNWCYILDKSPGKEAKITFSPIIRNVGEKTWKSSKDGYYSVGIDIGSSLKVKEYILSSFPTWYLNSGQDSQLEGFTVPYHPDNSYSMYWLVSHEEDTNKNNNQRAKGPFVSAKGRDFEDSYKLETHKCEFYKYQEFMQPYEDARNTLKGLHLAKGEKRILTILWDPQRPEHLNNLTRANIQSLIFGSGPSIKDYFLENSGGSLELIDSGISNWYGAKKAGSHYWQIPDTNDSDNDGWIKGHREKWAEAIRMAEADFDFSNFDLNNDKHISNDELIIVMLIPHENLRGFYREEVVGKEYPQEEPLIVDGVIITNIVEVYTGRTLNTRSEIGTFAHELSHALIGAGDMYFERPGNAPQGGLVTYPSYRAEDYSLMASHPANPPHLDPFHKLKAGWLVPEVITSSGWYELPDVETNHKVLILHDPKRDVLGAPDKINKEYFIIENRWRGNSYDARANIPDNGLAIWHIIEAPDQVLRKLPRVPEVQQQYWDSNEWQGWGRKGIRMIRPFGGEPYNPTLWKGGDSRIPDLLTLKWVDGTSSRFSIKDISPSDQIVRMRVEIR